MPDLRLALIGLVLLALLASCDSEAPPGPADPPGRPDPVAPTELSDPTVPETWVKSQWSPAFWFVLADVREFVGEERWASLDTAWMAGKGRADLSGWGPRNQNPNEHMMSGLWRLGLLREGVLAAIAELDGGVFWPLDPERYIVAWQPRVERWLRAEVRRPPKTVLRARLGDSWKAAVAAGDLKNAGRVVEAFGIWVGGKAAGPLRAEAHELVRKELSTIGENYHIGEGVLVLLECFGVPEGTDLKPVLAAVRRRYHELEDAVVPLPTPYDLHLACLRLERLMALK